MSLKFIDGEPEGDGPGRVSPLKPIVAELRANPGRWAELERFPKGDFRSASNRGQYLKRRYGVEYASRTVGNEVVLYLRAVTP